MVTSLLLEMYTTDFASAHGNYRLCDTNTTKISQRIYMYSEIYLVSFNIAIER